MTRRDAEGGRLLEIPDEQLRDDIHFLRECRNTLAHGGICTVDRVERMLGIMDAAARRTAEKG